MSNPDDANVGRRELLGAAGAVAAGAMLLNDTAGQDNPAANVVDRGATIRIRAMQRHRVGSKVYVKIETNQNVFGWGEISALEPVAANALAESLFQLLDGENPTRIEHLWQK